MKVGKFKEIYNEKGEQPKPLILPLTDVLHIKESSLVPIYFSDPITALKPSDTSMKSLPSISYDEFVNYKPKLIIKQTVKQADKPLHPGDATDLEVIESIISKENSNILHDNKKKEKAKENRVKNNKELISAKEQEKPSVENKDLIMNENNMKNKTMTTNNECLTIDSDVSQQPSKKKVNVNQSANNILNEELVISQGSLIDPTFKEDIPKHLITTTKEVFARMTPTKKRNNTKIPSLKEKDNIFTFENITDDSNTKSAEIFSLFTTNTPENKSKTGFYVTPVTYEINKKHQQGWIIRTH